MTPSIGTARMTPGPGVGSRAVRRWSWSLTSGELLQRNQRRPSALTAIEDWERGRARAGASRATRQVGHQQFHWGKPPPAAVPRRMTRMGLGWAWAGSFPRAGPGVAGLQKTRAGLAGGGPALGPT